jgi:hypothetical protein
MATDQKTDVADESRQSGNETAVLAHDLLQAESQDVTLGEVNSFRVASAETFVPEVTLTDSGPARGETLKSFAQQVYDGVRKGDAGAVSSVLESVTQAERAQIAQLYATAEGNSRGTTLRDDIARLDPVAFRSIEAVLDREDGKTNHAGNVMVALAVARKEGDGLLWDSDSVKGNAMLRAAFSTLTRDGFAELERSFEQRYGTSMSAAIEQTPGVSAADKQLLQFWRAGVDGRSADDIAAMARVAVQAKDLKMLQSVLTGSGDAAVQARTALQGDAQFMQTAEAAWGNRGWDGKVQETTQLTIARDLIREGNVSLATVVTGDKGVVFGFLDNNVGMQQMLERASDTERGKYIDGRAASEALARDPNATLSAEQQSAKQYFDLIEGAFKNAGNEREQSIYRDLLVNGRKTLASRLAEQHTEPTAAWLLGGFGGGHSMQNLMSQVENMPREDHALLADPRTRDSFRAQIESTLKTFEPDAAQRERVMALIDRKAGVSYEESIGVRRPLSEVLSDNPEATPDARRNVAEALLTMTAADVEAYKNDSSLRTRVDGMFAGRAQDTRDAASAYLAQSVLKQVAETGTVPELGPVELFARKVMRGEGDANARTTDAQTLLAASPTLRAHMQELQKPIDASGPAAQLNFSPSDQNLYTMLQGSFLENGAQMGAMAYKDAINGRGSAVYDTLRSGGSALFHTQKLYGEYERLSSLPADQLAIRRDFMNPQQQQVLDQVVAQGGNVTLADRMRSFVIGDGGKHDDFNGELTELQADPEKRNALFDEYQRKYGGNLLNDMTAAVPESSRIQIEGLLSEQTAQQQFFDRTAEVADQGGIVLDASRLELDRTLGLNQDMIAKYEAMRQSLPPELQAAISQHYSDSLKNFGDSKDRLADAGVDAVYLTASVAVLAATWGMSTPQLLTLMPRLAATGAASRPAMVAAIKGGDLENAEVFKQALRGAVEGASMVLPIPAGGRTDDALIAASNLETRFVRAGATTDNAATTVVATSDNAAPTVVATTDNAAPTVVSTSDNAAPTVVATTDNAATTAVAATDEVAPVVAPVKVMDEAPTIAPVQVADEVPVVAPVRAVEEAPVVAPVRAVEEAPVIPPAQVADEIPVPVAQVVDEAPVIAPARVVEEAPVVPPQVADEVPISTAQVVDELPLPTSVVDELPVVAPVKAVDEVPVVPAQVADEVPVPTAQVVDEAPVVAPVKAVDEVPVVPAQVADEVPIPVARVVDEAPVVTPMKAVDEAPVVPGQVADEVPIPAARVVDEVRVPAAQIADELPVVTPVQVVDDAPVIAPAQAIDEVPVIARTGPDETIRPAARTADEPVVLARNVDETPVPTSRETGPMVLGTGSLVEGATTRSAARAVIPPVTASLSESLFSMGAPVRVGEPEVVPQAEPENVEPLPAVPVEPVESEELPPLPAPNDRLMQLATVLPGEGPYQSAARILHEATGKRPDHKEVMALTRAIQRVYKAEHNGNGDMSGLRVRYQFITPQNFNMLLSEVQDEKTRQLLMGFAQQ